MKAFLTILGVLAFSTAAFAQSKMICGKASTEEPNDGSISQQKHPDLFTGRKTENDLFEAAKADLNTQLAKEKNLVSVSTIFQKEIRDDYYKPYRSSCGYGISG